CCPQQHWVSAPVATPCREAWLRVKSGWPRSRRRDRSDRKQALPATDSANPKLASQLFTDDLRTENHRAKFSERDRLRQVVATAIRQNHHPVGTDKFQRMPDAFGHDVGSLDVVTLDVDNSDTDFKRIRKLLEQVQVFPAAPRKFQRELMNLRVENRW